MKPSKTNEAEFENPRQSAEALGISRGSVYGLIGAGKSVSAMLSFRRM
jgi:hypothetical protein